MLQMVNQGAAAAASVDDVDCYELRLSNGFMSCLVPQPKCIDCPAKPKGNHSHFCYDQLDKQPLRLTVLKLDGSTFGIEVEQTGTVRDLKRAVESAFCHLPKKGPQSVSWEHVWGQFCLCHEGEKLLNDGDYIGMISIRDGDQFIRHTSYTHQLVGPQSRDEKVDSDDECDYSDGTWAKHQNSGKDDDTCLDTPLDSQDDVISNFAYGLTNTYKGWFSYHKFSSQPRGEERSVCQPRGEERSVSSKFSNNILGSFRNCIRISSNKRHPRRQTLRGE